MSLPASNKEIEICLTIMCGLHDPLLIEKVIGDLCFYGLVRLCYEMRGLSAPGHIAKAGESVPGIDRHNGNHQFHQPGRTFE
jgi:hypothetical protein